MRVAALVALFVAGLLAAAALAGAETTTSTTTETTTQVSTATQTTTETVAHTTTETVAQTTTRTVPLPAQTTTVSETSVDNTPAWIWLLLALLAAGVIGLLIALFGRRDRTMPVAERRRRLEGAIGTWVAQGWAVESQMGDSAVLRRGTELMLVAVDDAGGISSRPISP
ncbi:MAG TPA: hypothetical protein VFU10_04845 [Gaiellaceae bacterium]|nr:hypothetical protein [Gaiellaceae bacterium]